MMAVAVHGQCAYPGCVEREHAAGVLKQRDGLASHLQGRGSELLVVGLGEAESRRSLALCFRSDACGMGFVHDALPGADVGCVVFFGVDADVGFQLAVGL